MFNKLLLLLTLFVGINKINAQIGIGTTTPDASAVLDVQSTNKGILIPTISLTNTNLSAPINSPKNGLMVYNNNVVNDVEIGFYYWEDSEWIKFTNSKDEYTVNTTDYSGLTDGDSSPIPAEGEGIIVFSDPNFFGWDGTKWVQLN